EAAVALTVPGDIEGAGFANRGCRGGPKVPALLVTQIDRLSGRVADRIVRPGGQLVLAAVAGPGVAGTFRGHLKSEGRVGDHVDPGCRGRTTVPEDCHILPPFEAKTA